MKQHSFVQNIYTYSKPLFSIFNLQLIGKMRIFNFSEIKSYPLFLTFSCLKVKTLSKIPFFFHGNYYILEFDSRRSRQQGLKQPPLIVQSFATLQIFLCKLRPFSLFLFPPCLVQIQERINLGVRLGIDL